MKVPFLDLKLQMKGIRQELTDVFSQVMDQTAFAGGPFVERFEAAFAPYCGCEHAVGVGSGTDALWLALLASDVGPGDEVITVPNTFIATTEAISYCGAHPVFVDVDATSYNMDPALLEAAITPRTKAIIPVHLFGQMADMDPIMDIAKRHGLVVIEDASQAHGAENKGRRAGSIGHAGCFSFYPGKNLGACGEAGAVVTRDEQLAQRVRVLRDHGQPKKYIHEVIGWNGRMDGLQGAALEVKLKYLPEWTEQRRAHAERYRERLTDVEGIVLPEEASENRHVYHIYAIRTPDRDSVMAGLSEKGVGCGIHYPIPIHLQQAYASLGLERGTWPIAERCAEEYLSLPMFPELTAEQIDYVADVLRSVVQERHILEKTQSS